MERAKLAYITCVVAVQVIVVFVLIGLYFYDDDDDEAPVKFCRTRIVRVRTPVIVFAPCNNSLS